MAGHDPIGDAALSATGDETPDLTISDDRISLYLLNVDHPDGGPKAEFFLAHGFSVEVTEPFLLALFAHGCPGHLTGEMKTEFGVKYVYEGPMTMPNGTRHRVRSVWHKAPDDFRRLLVTAYPF